MNQITAKVLKDSKNLDNQRLVSMEWEYPRFIHSEVMTHRVFSRNAASSRAIPTKKMISQVWNNPAMPVFWGANQAGMQAKQEVKHPRLAKFVWKVCAKISAGMATALNATGLHKQISNRVLEPFQIMKIVVSATEWDNFFELRLHKDAQPEIQALAKEAKEAMDSSTPVTLRPNEWHLPYVDTKVVDGQMRYYVAGQEVKLVMAQQVSASCCAQVSYRALDFDLDKAERIYDRLVGSKPLHASPFEHQARPIGRGPVLSNFKGFQQLRSFIEER